MVTTTNGSKRFDLITEKKLSKLRGYIEKEFEDLTEEYNHGWGKMYGLDGPQCPKTSCTDGEVTWRGFDNPALLGKCLPYDCELSCAAMMHVCHMLDKEPVIQGATSKLTNFVVGPMGHRYEPKFRDGVTSEAEKKQDAMRQVKRGISWTQEHVSLGTRKGWSRFQRETFKRKIRGEAFVKHSIRGKDLKIRYAEPMDIKHPPSWDRLVNPEDIPKSEEFDLDDMDQRPPGKFGVLSEPSDCAEVLGYFEEVGPQPDIDVKRTFLFHSSKEMIHEKMLGDSNDERGIGLFYYSYAYIRMATKIMDSLFRISQIQAKYAAIWTFAETARVGKIEHVGQVVAKDNNAPEEIAPGEHMGKGWEIDLPGTKIRTNQWTAIIAQLLQFAGVSADLPFFMMSSSGEGGRSNNIAAEAPFELSVMTHQDNLNEFGIDLLWEGVRAFHGWSLKKLLEVQGWITISYKATNTATRDFHRYVSALVELLAAKVMSPKEVAQRTGTDYDMTEKWHEELIVKVKEMMDNDLDPSIILPSSDTISPLQKQGEVQPGGS